MSTFDYNSLLNVASDLIAQFGRPASFKRVVSSGTSTRACTVVETAYSPTERDGSNIQFTDRRFLCDAKGLTIPPSAEDDKLFLDGELLRIVTVTRIQPANLNLVWDLQVRR